MIPKATTRRSTPSGAAWQRLAGRRVTGGRVLKTMGGRGWCFFPRGRGGERASEMHAAVAAAAGQPAPSSACASAFTPAPLSQRDNDVSAHGEPRRAPVDQAQKGRSSPRHQTVQQLSPALRASCAGCTRSRSRAGRPGRALRDRVAPGERRHNDPARPRGRAPPRRAGSATATCASAPAPNDSIVIWARDAICGL